MRQQKKVSVRRWAAGIGVWAVVGALLLGGQLHAAPAHALDLPEPASPPLTPEGVDALNRVVAAAEARPEWAVRVAPDEITP